MLAIGRRFTSHDIPDMEAAPNRINRLATSNCWEVRVSAHAAVQGNSEHSQRSFEASLKAIGVPVAIAVAALIWFMQTPDGLSLQGHKALALFGGIFVLYLTE